MHVDLQRLDVQPAMLPQVEQTVVDVVDLDVLVVPPGGPVERQERVHAQPHHHVASSGGVMESRQAVEQHPLHLRQRSVRRGRHELDDMLLQLLADVDAAERELVHDGAVDALDHAVGDRQRSELCVVQGVLVLSSYGQERTPLGEAPQRPCRWSPLPLSGPRPALPWGASGSGTRCSATRAHTAPGRPRGSLSGR